MPFRLSRRGRPASAVGGRFRPSLLALEDRSVPSGVPTDWEVRGSGGGGALFAPQINPANPNEYFISSDMSELFHTTNAGASWDKVDFREIQGGHQTRVQYTNVPNLLYAMDYTSTGGIDYIRPARSTDGGTTWTPLANDPTGGEAFYFFADPTDNNRLVITDYTRLYFSDNGGASWQLKFTGDPSAGLIVGGAFWDGTSIYLGTNSGVLASTNGGGSFAPLAVGGLPAGHVILSFAGAKQGGTTRFVAVTMDGSDVWAGIPGYENGGGGRVATLDLGQSNWTTRSVPTSAWPFFAGMALADVNTMYVAGGSDAGSPTVYKSSNGGATWVSVLQTAGNANVQTGWSGQGGDRGWSYGELAMGFVVDAADPNRVIITDYGFAHSTTDGGASWKALYVSPADLNPAGQNTPPGQSYHDSGLDNTTSWQITWASATNLFISNSDIRGQLSTDGGETFGFGYTGHSRNSMYRVVVGANGTLYGAAASVHDLYQSTYLQDSRIDGGNGAVLFSTNGGATWQTLRDFGRVVSWVATDPTNSNRLFASVVHSTQGGIWVTNNLSAGAGATWTKLANPPRTEGHPFNIVVLNDGTLVVSYSGRRNSSGAFTASSGVFVSTDGGVTWSDRSHTGMRYWTKDVVVDPHDSTQNTWYSGVFSGWGGPPNGLGGLYKTTDRGVTWTRILTRDRVTSATFNPADPNEVFVTTETEGLWYSNNIRSASPAFTQVASYSFRQPERVFFNPYNANEIWVTSFGGGVMVGSTAAGTPGTVQLASATYSVNEGGGTVTVTVNRTGGSTGAVSVQYATSNGTATAGSDYTATNGSLNWADGDTSPKTFTVPITDDSTVESSETFNLTLTGVTGGAVLGSPSAAAVTITDNDVSPPPPPPPPPPPVGSIQFVAASVSVNEAAGTVSVMVRRSGGSAGAVSVQYASADGTAVAPGDYTTSTGTLSWANGDTADKTITVPISNDSAVEPSETFNLTLSNPTGGAALGSITTNTATIVDNDVSPPPPPPPPTGAGQPFAVGTDSGHVATVTMYNSDGTLRFISTPFGTYTGGVRVAVGDVTGDGVADVVAGTNGGMYNQVRIIDGATGQLRPNVLTAGDWYYGAASVAVGDVTGDGVGDIAVGANDGPQVTVYRGGDFARLARFAPGPKPNFWGRTSVALADVTGDGTADLVVSGLYPNGNRIAGFNGLSLRPGVTPTAAFTPYFLTGRGFSSGIHLAAGDVNADGFADLVFGSSPWDSARVLVTSGRQLVQSGQRVTLADFTPPGTSYGFGTRVAVRDLDGDGKADLLLGSGTGRGSHVRVYLGANLSPTGTPPAATDFDAYPGFTGGVFVG